MNNITLLIKLNRCCKITDLMHLMSEDTGPDEACALYKLDKTKQSLRKVDAFGHPLSQWPPTIPEGDDFIWHAIHQDDMLSQDDVFGVPLLDHEHNKFCFIIHGEALANKIMAVKEPILDTILRCYQAEYNEWMSTFLYTLGGTEQAKIIIANPDGDLIYYSQSLEDLMGWTEEEIRENGWTNLVYPDPEYRMEVTKALATLILSGIGSNGTVRKLRCKNGNTIEMAIWSYVGPSLYNGPPSLIGFMSDVTTERNEIRRSIHSDNLERLGRLSSSVAHDFNNLLCSIMGHADLLRIQPYKMESVQRRSQVILNSCKKGAALTKQLLTIGGLPNAIKKTINTAKAVEEILNLFIVNLPKNITLTCHVDTPALNINADPALFSNAILNLLINANDAIGLSDGTIEVHIGQSPLPETLFYQSPQLPQTNKDYSTISISDSGSGFSQEAMANIFQPFFSTKPLGHGLGLHTVVSFLSTHNGALNIENSNGASMTLYFPISEKPEDYLEELTSTFNGCGQIVWLVDNELHVLEFASIALTSIGCSVRSFSSSDEAYQAIQQTPELLQPVLVILDTVKPNELKIHEILEGFNSVRAILSTSDCAPKQLEGTPTLKQYFLQKPYSASTLKTTVSNILAQLDAQSL